MRYTNEERAFPNMIMTIDYLAEMLKIQKEFQIKTGFDPLIKDLANAIMCEGGELSVEAGAKWWKDYEKNGRRWGKMTFEQAFYQIKTIELENHGTIQVEAIDVLHFLLCVFIACGMDSKAIYETYCAKMGVNLNRQDNGY